jgi:hypothetical protein
MSRVQNAVHNSIQFFIIYVPRQQPQGQLQTHHSVNKSNYIMDNHNIKSKSNYRRALEENTLMQRSKQTKSSSSSSNNNNNNNFIIQINTLIIINHLEVCEIQILGNGSKSKLKCYSRGT